MITFEDARPGATPDQLEATETAIGGSLPSDLRTFLLEHDGAIPSQNVLIVDGDVTDVGVAEFLSLSGIRSLLAELANLRSIHDDLVPFALTEGGGVLLCSRDPHRLGAITELGPGVDPELWQPTWLVRDLRELLGSLIQLTVEVRPGDVRGTLIDGRLVGHSTPDPDQQN
jgi:cell wall assembly regulator SMI1